MLCAVSPGCLNDNNTSSVVDTPLVETHTRPAIIEHTSHPEKIVEVQPVVREIVQPQVHVIEKHLHETVPSVITKPTIVEETVKPRIIEVVQRVIHREVPAPIVELLSST